MEDTLTTEQRYLVAHDWLGGVCSECGSEDNVVIVNEDGLTEDEVLAHNSPETFWTAVDKSVLLCDGCRTRS